MTARLVPLRPDLHAAIDERGRADGRVGRHNAWVIDTLVEGDVLVVDLFAKVRDGTFVGDNLATAVRARTGRGLVVDGGIRDLERVAQPPHFALFARGVDPSAIADVTMVGVNGPIRIGGATVLPGDVVLGTKTGVTFIPPHLAREVVESSEDVRLRDVFGKQRLREGRYGSGEIDVQVWAPAIETDFVAWRRQHDEAPLPAAERS